MNAASIDAGSLADHHFFLATTQEECWSRLEFIVEQPPRLAVLLGAPEVGKSRMLQALHGHALQSHSCSVHQIDASGLTFEECASQLADTLGTGDPHSGWREIEDWLYGTAVHRTSSLWILDHLDQAQDDLSLCIRRLVRIAASCRAPASVVIAARRSTDVAKLADMIELRCDLPAWDLAATEQFLELDAERVRSAARFTSAAVQAIYDCTGGIAGRVARLSRLSRLASDVEEANQIDVDLVLEVWTKLMQSGNSSVG